MSSGYFIAKPAWVWIKQAQAAFAALEEIGGKRDPIIEYADIQPHFGLLVEALNALAGAGLVGKVDDDLIQAAGLRPVSEVLGGA